MTAASSARHDVFQAVADPTRRQLMQLLAGQEMPVTAISRHFPMSRTAVSKHLRILEEAGLVHERKVGRETRYRLEASPLRELQQWLAYYERFWENKMEALKRYVENPGDTAEPGQLKAVEEHPQMSGRRHSHAAINGVGPNDATKSDK